MATIDRDEFHREIEQLVEKLGVKTVQELNPEMVILVSPAKDFDPATDKYLWQLPDNQSAVRDVYCSSCKAQVAMSNWMYRKYAAMEKKPKVCCTNCVQNNLKDIGDELSQPQPQSSTGSDRDQGSSERP